MGKRMKRGAAVLAGVAVLAFAALRFFHQGGAVEEETRPSVKAAAAETRDIVNTSEVIGTLEPQEEAEVFPKIGGEIVKVAFAAGDRVEAGQELAVIHSDAIEGLQIQLASAKIAMADAETALGRTEALFAAGAVSQQQLEGAQSAAESARLAYRSAETQLTLQSSYTSVKAPISGVIESKRISEHDQANPAAPICTISGSGGMGVRFGVPGEMMRRLSVGDSVTVQKGTATVRGSITEISGRISEASGLCECRASLEEAEAALNSGAKVKLILVSARAENVPALPLSAVSYAGGAPFVYVLSEGKALRRELETGIFDEQYIELRGGLEEGDAVIVSWSKELYDGAEVLAE